MGPGDWILANGRYLCRIGRRETAKTNSGEDRDRYYFDVGMDWAWADECKETDLETVYYLIKKIKELEGLLASTLNDNDPEFADWVRRGAEILARHLEDR